MTNSANLLRTFAYVAGVVGAQADDPLCRACKSFAETLEKLRSSLPSVTNESPTESFLPLLSAATDTLGRIQAPVSPIPQRKIGSCSLPGKVCMVKHALSVFESVITP